MVFSWVCGMVMVELRVEGIAGEIGICSLQEGFGHGVVCEAG